MAKVDYATLKKGGFMRQKQKNNFSLRLACVGGTLTAENLKVFVLEAFAAGTAANGNEQTIHCTFSPKVSFSTFSASAGGLQLSPQPVSA